LTLSSLLYLVTDYKEQLQ